MESGEVSLSLDQSVAPSEQDIWELQRALSKLPQIEPVSTHYFADGMYCRSVYRDAGTLVVGKVHKKEHFFILADGEMSVWSADVGVKRVKAPYVWVSKPGTKRVTYAHTNSTAVTVHRTDLTDLDAIEKELIEDDPSAMYGSGNTLLKPVLEHKE